MGQLLETGALLEARHNHRRHRVPEIGLLALVALIALSLTPSDGIGFSVCPFHALTGYPGPGCGLTRSVSSALHWELAKSFHYHPFGIPLALAGIALAVEYLRAEVKSHSGLLDKWRRFMPALVIVFLIIWFLRLGASLIYAHPFFG